MCLMDKWKTDLTITTSTCFGHILGRAKKISSKYVNAQITQDVQRGLTCIYIYIHFSKLAYTKRGKPMIT